MNDLPRNNEILDDEVNLFEVISVLNAAKIFIIFSTIIFSLIGIFFIHYHYRTFIPLMQF